MNTVCAVIIEILGYDWDLSKLMDNLFSDDIKFF